jgi:hypothetical protein
MTNKVLTNKVLALCTVTSRCFLLVLVPWLQGDTAGARACLTSYNTLLLAAGKSACEECAVCYEPLTGSSAVTLLGCGHIFHRCVVAHPMHNVSRRFGIVQTCLLGSKRQKKLMLVYSRYHKGDVQQTTGAGCATLL